MYKNIYNIPAGLPFLDTLAANTLRLYADDPLVFSNISIFLPSRRACKELAEAFLRVSGGKPMLLPQIQPLGDIDDEELLFLGYIECENDIPNIISPVKQRLLLTELIEKWQTAQKTDEKITIPQAAHLAIELSSFLSEVQKQQLSFNDIEKIVPDELSRHWQITLDFLHILIEKWPQILKENNAVDVNTQRNISLKAQADYWQKNPSEYPVIAAGSTGSIPATAQLLKVISQMPSGQVILPGLDMNMDNAAWEKIEQTHPQYGLKNLLEIIGVGRNEVKKYDCTVCSAVDRDSLISVMMLPADVTDKWSHSVKIENSHLEGIEVIEASGLQEEATVIALKMKEILQQPEKTAALITNRRDLAKRVSGILQKWNVQIDDSAGSHLNSTPQAVFLRLLAAMVADRGENSVSLLGLLKNPYANCGLGAKEFKDNVRKLEIACMRGIRNSEGFKGYYNKIDSKLSNRLKNVEEILQPMFKLMSRDQIAFDAMLKTHIQVAQNIAADDKADGVERLWSSDSGGQLKDFLDELLISSKDFKQIDPTDYLGLLDALLTGQTYRPQYGSHPRLHILSPIEARMLRFDLVILGELNEGEWPLSGKSDPWMSRPMRDDFGLPLPEKKIGQSAHDFVQLLSSENVLITRSEKLDGTQTIPSRWLLRLDAVLNITGKQGALKPKLPWVKWARLLNKADSYLKMEAPCPNPPVECRPRKLSVTSIEKLMRDPYWIYANKILHLKKLDEIDKEPGGAEFGNFVHDVLEEFIKQYDSIKPEDRYTYLLELGRNILQKENLKSAIISFWFPRFERIAAWIVQNEEKRRENNIDVLTEIKGKYNIIYAGEIFTLEARADRVEIDEDGNICIVDYKTGTPPSAKEVKLGLSPQMTLEGVIAKKGGFDREGKVKSLEYWKLSGGQKDTQSKYAGYKNQEELASLLEDAENGAKSLIEVMFFQENPFLSIPNKEKEITYNDYKHLERVKEWGE
ncbi:MAG: double-strand break repair protein AddB [Alphaproteobacteria bacterium CG11_big_fil_rev_8_21_14_0_20_39_49]|nr:MAG: double-strand break repair protein AddB [Alphaproteobacteria bacterium CG11_big_fil_rev_8_21_14_0_20_39_49]